MTATSRALRSPPPLWFVRNGEVVVGPMTTTTLLRGVSYGRVPGDSLVRGQAWTEWRRLPDVREVGVLQRLKARVGNDWHPPEGWLPPSPADLADTRATKMLKIAQSQAESLLMTLSLAVQETGAEVGLVHWYRSPQRAFVTSFTHGPHVAHQVGATLEGHDAACASALRGRGLMASNKGVGPVRRAIAARLEQPPLSLRGIAMFPLHAESRLCAMVELGRSDHTFRACDKARLEGVRRAVERRLEHGERTGWRRTQA